jgi:SAM-dependent methyltransferase
MLTRLIHMIDSVLPGPRVRGRESSEAYSDWEYESGKTLLAEYSTLFGELKGKRILDIGCGLGGKSVVYSEAGAEVTGVDIDQSHATGALEYAEKKECGLSVIIGDAMRLPMMDGSFDIVIANDSMEHFADPGSALAEFVRVTGKDGKIFLFFTPWGSPLASHLYDYIHTPWCHLLFSERMLERLLELTLEKRGEEEPGKLAADLMERYRLENNRIRVSTFRELLRNQPGIEILFMELKPPRFSFLRPLTGIPLFGELFTGTVTAVLCRK